MRERTRADWRKSGHDTRRRGGTSHCMNCGGVVEAEEERVVELRPWTGRVWTVAWSGGLASGILGAAGRRRRRPRREGSREESQADKAKKELQIQSGVPGRVGAGRNGAMHWESSRRGG